MLFNKPRFERGFGEEIGDMNLGLTADEKKQLLALLDKIKENHCKNYHSNLFGWNCSREPDNEACPFEYEAYSEDMDDFYCPVFLICNVLEDEAD